MAIAYYDEAGNYVKECPKCKVTKPTEEYTKHKSNKDGLSFYCGDCNRASIRARNQRRAKKRKQKSHKLLEHHIEWIRNQQLNLSVRQTAKEFSKRFHDMTIAPSTVQRIFSGKVHLTKEKKKQKEEENTISIYDMIQEADSFDGDVEEYLETKSKKKIKF